jgi:transcriptional regulator with XRE-family HTH domain
MNVGKALKLCRSAKDLSLETVAERAGISVSHLSRIENSKREPTLPLINKIARALSVPTAVVIFMASEDDELEGLDEKTGRRFEQLALDLIRHS